MNLLAEKIDLKLVKDHEKPENTDMVKDIIMLVGGNYLLTLLIIGLIAGWLSLANKPKPRSVSVIAEALLSYYMLFAIGINNLINFVSHVFFGELSASFIGWADSPFQTEVGFASLGIGITGVLAFRAGLPFRVATYIPPAFFSRAPQAGTYIR